MAVSIPNKLDGKISLGKVVYVRKARYSSRVIMNRGTEENPYFNIHPRAAFRKGVAKEWLNNRIYACKDLPKNIIAK